mmetsp:Transcript_138783/g.431729  ORF Transcript_138783/g.431729 Transcript_138783/m.431729 type:complete len:230 (-) Transcript_138783:82-771(-)
MRRKETAMAVISFSASSASSSQSSCTSKSRFSLLRARSQSVKRNRPKRKPMRSIGTKMVLAGNCAKISKDCMCTPKCMPAKDEMCERRMDHDLVILLRRCLDVSSMLRVRRSCSWGTIGGVSSVGTLRDLVVAEGSPSGLSALTSEKMRQCITVKNAKNTHKLKVVWATGIQPDAWAAEPVSWWPGLTSPPSSIYSTMPITEWNISTETKMEMVLLMTSQEAFMMSSSG